MKRTLLATAAALAVGCADDAPRPTAPPSPQVSARQDDPGAVSFRLTVLHNNDGESALIDAGQGLEDFGGVARFATLVSRLKAEAAEGAPTGDAAGAARGVILVSSGDNFLAGPELNASLENGVPFYDAIAMDLIGYDAAAIGNHEFDFGPDVLADFIAGFTNPVPFLSANLDVSAEGRLQALVGQGRIAKSTVVTEGGEEVGIVGATTPRLRSISSPRRVTVMADVAAAVQAEVSALQARGVDKIVLISHLQSIEEDLLLIPLLDDVDVVVAGGGDELLANDGDLLLPGQSASRPYPLVARDQDGTAVPVVTTEGGYRYVGRLVVGFDDDGNVVAVDESSGPVRVASSSLPDGVAPDPEVQRRVTEPVTAAVAELASTILGRSEVPLNGLRTDVRTRETNEGNLIADALLWQAARLAPSFGAPQPDVAIQNGGGIRNGTVVPPGPISALTTFNILPFANFVAVVPNVSRAQFKEVLENAVSRVAFVDGRFAQVAGFRFEWDSTRAAQVVDAAGNVVTPGRRVRTVRLSDGTTIVAGGEVQQGAALTIATIDFSARGGDEYPFRNAAFTTLGVTYQQALANYITGAPGTGALGGVISGADYPEGGEGRIRPLAPGAPAVERLIALGPSAIRAATGLNGALIQLRLLDARGDGPWTLRIDWGDGEVNTPRVTRTGTLSFLRSKAFAAPGSYAVTVTATDAAGVTGTTAVATLTIP